VWTLALTAALATPTFTPLGNLDGAPGCNSNGCYWSADPRVSADGTTVVGESYNSGTGYSAVPFTPFAWTPNGFNAIGPTQRDLWGVRGIDAAGTVVVGTTWTASRANGWRDQRGALGVVGRNAVVRAAAPDARRVAGIDSQSNATEVWVWSVRTGAVAVMPMPGIGEIGVGPEVALSADGTTVGGQLRLPNFDSTPVVWDRGQVVLLGDLNLSDPSGSVTDLSDNGGVAVGYSRLTGFGWAGFRWEAATGLVSLAGTSDQRNFSPARACNADASVIVGQMNVPYDTEPRAWVWTAATGMEDLQERLLAQGLGPALRGWTLIEATDVSADGTVIVGNGLNPDGEEEAWVVTL
jgi:uncharacterized membrane protein